MVGALLLALDAAISRSWAITLSVLVALAIVVVWLVHPHVLARRSEERS